MLKDQRCKLARHFISTKSSDGGGQDPVSVNPQTECLSSGVLSYCEALVTDTERDWGLRGFFRWIWTTASVKLMSALCIAGDI